MILEVRLYGDPVLRKPFERVSSFDAELKRFAEDMIETMHDERGVGLAAQQVGETRSVCVVHVPEDYDVDEEGNRLHPDVAMPLVLVNPEITWMGEEKEKAEEGCLSFPGINGNIPRSLEIELTYQDLEGNGHQLKLQQFLARVVQHEVDHLNGKLFIDRMSSVKKAALGGRLKRMKKETEQRLGI